MPTSKKISAAKLAACRNNAKKSTGPKSAAGKARSSQNARRHGLSARGVPDSVRAAFEAHRSALLDDYRPANKAELDVFEQLAHASFCLDQIRDMELALLSRLPIPFDDPATANPLSTLDRYRARHTRDYHKSLKTLQDLQTQRTVLDQQEPLAQSVFRNSAPAAAFTRLTKQTDRLFNSNLKSHFSSWMRDAVRDAIDQLNHPPRKVHMSVESTVPAHKD